MLNKFIAAVAVSLVAATGMAAPSYATTPAPRPGVSPEQAAGIDAPMNWRRVGAGQAATSSVPVGARARTTPQVAGLDVSSHTGNPSAATWASWAKTYAFVFVKSTQGNWYTNPSFSAQYSGATNAGMLRGSYHFASPNLGGGAEQADYFVNHGGGWTPDGRTLPGVLDIEYNPYSDPSSPGYNGTNTCYNFAPAAMTAWIKTFSNRYLARTGVYPTIYTTVGWWKKCTGNTDDFATTNPFWIADPNAVGGPSSLPAGSATWTYWQYGSGGTCRIDNAVDCNKFNGPITGLQSIASDFAYTAGSHFAWATKLGHPITAERTVTAFGRTGYAQDFANMKGQPTRAVRVGGVNYTVTGSILRRLDNLGGLTGYGWPASAMRTNIVAGVQGWAQRFRGATGSVLVASKYGTFPISGPIRARWREAQRGWPTSLQKSGKTVLGAAAWQQRFSGPKGADYATNPKQTTNVYWRAGAPQ